jgi:hypothetical protein
MNRRAIRARRKREGRGLPPPGRVASPAPPSGEAEDPEIDVARYIAEMTAQLASMARAAKLDLLAYFLSMAHAESEGNARGDVDCEPT